MIKQRPSFDIAIIGAGIIGTAIARELARYQVKIALFEKDADVGQGTSCRNSGVVHAGFTCPVGSLKAEVCMEGNRVFADFCRELDVPYKKVGKLVIARDKEQIPELYRLRYVGQENGVDLRIIGWDDIKKMEPNVSAAVAAMHSPDSAITNPYLLSIACAENAVMNGVEIFLNTAVRDIEWKESSYLLQTGQGDYRADYVINAAGLYSDRIARMSGEDNYRIYPNRGEYYILDNNKSHLISRLIYPVPPLNSGGLGIHLTPTVDGNILIGPSTEYIDKRDDFSTTVPVLEQLLKEARDFVPGISAKDRIRSYAGIRSKIVPPSRGGFGDFIIKASPTRETFINLIGIESPGLTSAPGIARYVVNMIDQRENLRRKNDFQDSRKANVVFSELPETDKVRLSRENPDYGEVVCRCEGITKGEILSALNNPLGVRTVKGIKYRTRATMGRCQGGYCLSRIINIMQEAGMEFTDITLNGGTSRLFSGQVKGVI